MRIRVLSLLLCALLLAVKPARHDEFALGLFGQLRSHPGNVVVSPANVVDALTLIERAASGTTRRELDRAMRGALPVRDPAIISSAALWADSVTLRPSYAAAVRELGGSVQEVSFADPPSARARINAWASRATNGRIDRMIDAESLGRDTRLVVTSAMYMKAAWRSEFDPNDTRAVAFHLDNIREARVPTMKRTLVARYAATIHLQVLELRYAVKGLSMMIVLPKSADSLPSVEAAMTPELITRWTAALKEEDVELFLPRFHTAAHFELKPALSALGIRRLFDRVRGAELPGIISKQPLSGSSFMHTLRIDVDEAGTEASASSVGAMVWTSTAIPPPPIPFHVDHPFIYLIRSGDQILFLGRVTDPRG